jgi:hypothetical protein
MGKCVICVMRHHRTQRFYGFPVTHFSPRFGLFPPAGEKIPLAPTDAKPRRTTDDW